MSTFLLFLALLPGIALMVYVYRKDKVEPEPVRLVARLFLLGAIAGPIAAIAENVIIDLFHATLPEGAVLLVLENFIGVAAVEEALKYVFLNTIRKNPEFDHVFDGIVYAVAVSLGFATLENVLYVFDGGLETALMRAVFSVPGHCADGVIMGVFFGLARQREVAGNTAGARSYYWLAFLLPTIEHGFYDCALSTESDLMALLALGVDIAFIIFAMKVVGHMSKNDQAIFPDRQQPVYGQPQPVPQPYQQLHWQQQYQQPYAQPYQQPRQAPQQGAQGEPPVPPQAFTGR